jgi:hypothetical protein
VGHPDLIFPNSALLVSRFQVMRKPQLSAANSARMRLPVANYSSSGLGQIVKMRKQCSLRWFTDLHKFVSEEVSGVRERCD